MQRRGWGYRKGGITGLGVHRYAIRGVGTDNSQVREGGEKEE